MLKPSYDKLEDIPQEKRGAYILREGKYVLDDLSDDHPDVVERKRLEAESSGRQGTITRLTNENTELKSKQIPEGHVPVPAADKEFIDVVKPLGTAAVIKTRLEDADKLQQREHLREVEKVMGWKPDSLHLVPGLPALEITDVMENGQPVKDDNGQVKKQVMAKIPGENNTTTVKQFRDYFDQTSTLKSYEPLLIQTEQQIGTELPSMGAGGGGGDISLAASLINNRYGDNAKPATT